MKPAIARLGLPIRARLLVCGLACALGCGWSAARERELDRPVALAAVDEVEVRLLGHQRSSAAVVVRGTLPDGCTRLDRVRRHRSGRDFEFTLTTVREPTGGCPPEPRAFERSITLYLDPIDYGQYRAIVNGVSRSFYVSSDPLLRDGITDFGSEPGTE